MENFVAYHSAQRMGYELESSTELQFLSKKLGLLKKAIGNKVWVIQGKPDGKKTAFTLCGAYLAERIAAESPSSDVHVIYGQRIVEFNPPLPLNQLDWFPFLMKSQSNFSLGFNRLSDQIILQALNELEFEVANSAPQPPLPDIDFSMSGTEGTTQFVSHLRRERDRSLVATKKAAVLSTTGKLSCEVCGFDFSTTYGSLGDGFCEIHHLTPLSISKRVVNTTLADLAVLCSNCHRVIHRSDPMLSVIELSNVVRNGLGNPESK